MINLKNDVPAALIEYDAATGTELAVVDTNVDQIEETTLEINTATAETLAAVLEIQHSVDHQSVIFPSNTNLTCTLTALDTANTFSDYAEIADSVATKLSAAFSTMAGHITAFTIESLSETDTIYHLEITHGEMHALLTNIRFAGATKFTTPSAIQRILGPAILVGEKVYYRMKTSSAVADTALVNFRYHTHV